MLTQLNLDLDFTKKVLCTTSKNITPSTIGGGVPVYIPLLMSKITKGEPKVNQLKTNGKSVFKNDNSCKPKAKSVIKEKNYLLAKREDNISLTRILKKDGNEYVIPKDTKLQASFTHGKLSSITFNTDTLI